MGPGTRMSQRHIDYMGRQSSLSYSFTPSLDLLWSIEPSVTPRTGQPQVGDTRTCDAVEQLGIGLQIAAGGREMICPQRRCAWLTEG